VFSLEDTSMCESTRGCLRGLGRGLRTTTYSALFVETGVWAPVLFAWTDTGAGAGISSWVVSAMAKTDGRRAALVPLRLDTVEVSASSSDESDDFWPRRASASRISSCSSSSSRCWT
jgi:hypothetical protein